MKPLGILVCLVFAAAAAAQPMVIDGRCDASEWSGATVYAFDVVRLDGSTAGGKLFVKNDAQNLYVCMRVEETSLGVGPSFTMEFDAPGTDGEIGDDDDYVAVSASGPWCSPMRFHDGIRFTEPPCDPGVLCGLDDVDMGGTSNGNGTAANDGTYTAFELWHPLASGDTANDIQVGAGDKLYFRVTVRYAEDPSNFVETQYPETGLELYDVTP